MKKLPVSLPALALIALLASLSVTAAVEAAPAQDRARIAVVAFDNNSTWHWWGDNLGAAAADELATQLVRSGAFTVIERRELESLLSEQDLGQSGRVNQATAARVGELLGAQIVVTGSITQFSIDTKGGGIGGIGVRYSVAESIVDVRVVNTVTGEIMVVAEGEGDKRMGSIRVDDVSFQRDFDAGVAQEALRPAIEEAVEQIVAQAGTFASLAPVAPPASIVGYRGDDQIYLDRGENFDIRVGDRYVVLRVIDEITDAQGNVLDRITDTVGTIEVTRVLSQSAICRLVEGEVAEGDTVRKTS